MAGPHHGRSRRVADRDPVLLVVDDPVTGLIPWLVFSFLPDVTTFQVSAALAFLAALATAAVARLRGERLKPLELADVVLFAVLVVMSFLQWEAVDAWWEDHADLVSNAGLALMAAVTLAIGRPFTAPYTSARFPDMPPVLQQRLDRTSTRAWGLGFLAAAVVAAYGEYVLGDPDDIWTAWILQLLPLLLAYHATIWLDQRSVARWTAEFYDEPSGWDLVRDIVVWLAPIGLLALAFGSSPVWLAWSLILLGLTLTVVAWQLARRWHAVRHLVVGRPVD